MSALHYVLLLGRCVFRCVHYMLGNGTDGANEPREWLSGGETETWICDVNICNRGAGNPVVRLVLCLWMQPNPEPVWSRRNWICFCFFSKLFSKIQWWQGWTAYPCTSCSDSVVSLLLSMRLMCYMQHSESHVQTFPIAEITTEGIYFSPFHC